jgi:hypothetical protein
MQKNAKIEYAELMEQGRFHVHPKGGNSTAVWYIATGLLWGHAFLLLQGNRPNRLDNTYNLLGSKG